MPDPPPSTIAAVASVAVRTHAIPTSRIVISPEFTCLSTEAHGPKMDYSPDWNCSYLILKNNSKKAFDCGDGLLSDDLSVNTGVLELL